MPSDSQSRARPLSAPRLDRHDQERQDSAWLSHVWEQPHTRVLYLDQGAAAIGGASDPTTEALSDTEPRLLLSAPQGALPDTAVYLGEVGGEDSETF